MIVAPARRSLVTNRNTRIGETVRCVRACSGDHEKTGPFRGRTCPDAVAPDVNQICFESVSSPHVPAAGAETRRTRSSADPRFDMALHDRCDLLVRGACGGRQVGCRRPSGQCTGSHEKGPPHLSRSCVARVGGPFNCLAFPPSGQLRRRTAAVKAKAPHSGFLRSRQPEMSPARLSACAFVRLGPDPFLRRNRSGFA